MVSGGNGQRSSRWVKVLECVDCGERTEIDTPMIKHRLFSDWVCEQCLIERRLGIENSSRFLKWLKKRR